MSTWFALQVAVNPDGGIEREEVCMEGEYMEWVLRRAEDARPYALLVKEEVPV